MLAGRIRVYELLDISVEKLAAFIWEEKMSALEMINESSENQYLLGDGKNGGNREMTLGACSNDVTEAFLVVCMRVGVSL